MRIGPPLQGLPRPGRRDAAELVRARFEGLAGECDWVALRELVPAATAPLPLAGGLPEDVAA